MPTTRRLLASSTRRSMLLTLVVNATCYLLIAYAQLNDFGQFGLVRYLALLPITLAAHWFGLLGGILTALFYCLVIIPDVFWAAQVGFPLPSISPILSYVLFLLVYAYIVSDTISSLRIHSELRSQVEGWSGLLERARSREEVVNFLLDQAQQAAHAAQSALLVLNPVNNQWELLTTDGQAQLAIDATDGAFTLGRWLLEQNEVRLLTRQEIVAALDPLEPAQCPTDLMSVPLRHRDGTRLGNLIVFDRLGRIGFTGEDLNIFGKLAAAGESALEQAGYYARANFSLGLRVHQLSAIEKAIRQFNEHLDVRSILDAALHSALQIAGGQRAAMYVEVEGLHPYFAQTGYRMGRAQFLAMRAMKDRLVEPGDCSIAGILGSQDTRIGEECLAVPLRTTEKNLGVLIVERAGNPEVRSTALTTLLILAGQTVIALNNTSLLSEVNRERTNLDKLITSIADGMIATDSQGIITRTNPAAEALTGWRADDMLGKMVCSVMNCHNDTNTCDNCGLVRAIAQGIAWEQRLTIRQRLGAQRVVLVRTAPVPGSDHRPAGAAILFNDITRADELETAQKHLISTISHEIRTPLTNLTAISEALRREMRIKPDTQVANLLDLLGRQSLRLSEFFDKVLDVDRLDTGRITLQSRPVPLGYCLHTAAHQLKVTQPKRKVIVELPDGDLWGWADESALNSVLTNLVDNAIKYSPPDSPITLRLERGSGGSAQVSVIDQGVGIAPDNLPRIFERFFRVQSGDAQTVYGHGLGLYIARGWIEAMGGSIRVQSTPGKGSQFTFCLPLMETDYAEEDSGH